MPRNWPLIDLHSRWRHIIHIPISKGDKVRAMVRIVISFLLTCVPLVSGCAEGADKLLLAALSRYRVHRGAALVSASAPIDESDLPANPTNDKPTWLATGQAMTLANRDQTGSGKEAPGVVHWRNRRGPAYPNDFWRSFGRDAKEMSATLWDDAKATATNPVALIGLGLAGAAGISLAASEADDQVADHFSRKRSQLNTFWDNVGDVGGNPGTHFAVAGTMYFASLARADAKNYEVSKTLLNALALNGITTLALKGIVRTRSPNGESWGWPSGHASSSFCFATVIYENYGPGIGIPLFAFAGFVGYERIDARNHDFSDVISGALIGIAIGHAVSQNHQPKILGMDVVPFVDPEGSWVGLALSKQW